MTRAEAPVSVIIPSFGRQNRLAAAIASAAPELGPGDEIIVVDDGSTPPIILPNRSDPRVRLVRLEINRGAASARNAGIRAATHPLIAFLDSDDLWLPGKLAAQRRLLGDASADLVAVVCGWRDVEDGRVLRERRPRPSRSRSDFFAGCWFCPGTTLLIEKRAFALCGPLHGGLRRLEDLEWFLRFARAGGVLQVADHIGAVIARGGNGRPAAVAAGARVIEDTVATLPDVTGRERSELKAYLDLERAAAHRNVGRRAATAFYLARSLWRRPRGHLQLRDWWAATP